MLYVVQCGGEHEGNTILGATTDKKAAIREAKKRAEIELVYAHRYDSGYERVYEHYDLSEYCVYSVSFDEDSCGYSWDVFAFEDGFFYPHHI